MLLPLFKMLSMLILVFMLQVAILIMFYTDNYLNSLDGSAGDNDIHVTPIVMLP